MASPWGFGVVVKPRVLPPSQFSCCGGVSYKDWSQNMYFNCTMDNPSRERCSVPFSCCLPDDDGVRLVSPWIHSAPPLPSLGWGQSSQKRRGPPSPAWCGFCPQVVINTMCGRGIQAMGYVEASAVIYTHGCIDSLVNWINSNLFLLGGIALGLAAPQVLRGEKGHLGHLNDVSHH